MNIKYLGYARYSTAQLINEVFKEKDNRALHNDAATVRIVAPRYLTRSSPSSSRTRRGRNSKLTMGYGT